ncbi:MAG: dephospho-CoA kinase [bacterium]|nr:dephospho-CoA kinase [bacterium]
MRVAVTGNMGSGKSTLARMLQELGASLVDADALARRVVEEDPEVRRDLVAAFGSDLIDTNGALDRRALARRALTGTGGRRQLEGIIRPRLEPILAAELAHAETVSAIAVFDAPLVFEWGIQHWFERVFVVSTEADTAASRVADSRGLGTDEVHERRAAQTRIHEYAGDVEFVDNNGTLLELRSRAEEIWSDLRRTLSCGRAERE